MTTRVLKEQRHTLRGSAFQVETSNRGGSIVHIDPKHYPRITRPVQGELEHGRASGLFVCPRLFARTRERKLLFRGEFHELCYPEDVDAAHVDPDRMFLHDLPYLYTWEQLPGADEEQVSYHLSAARLPKNDPLPFSSTVTYRLERNSLVITAAVHDTLKPTPALLAIHPYLRSHLGSVNDTIQLRARARRRFDYPPDSKFPMSDGDLTDFRDGGPFAAMAKLPPNLDHSYLIQDGECEIYWNDGPRIMMADETAGLPAHYLHVWTTSARSGNVCGIEHGALANACGLIAFGVVPEAHVQVVNPGERKERIVRYTLLS